MATALMILGAVSGLELLLWLPWLWRWRKFMAVFLMAALTAANGLLLVGSLRLWLIVLSLLSLYRLVNLWRVFKGTIQADYLYHAARRTSLWLIGLQAADLGLAKLTDYWQLNSLALLYVVVAGQMLIGLILWVTTKRHIKTTTIPRITGAYADRDLPSLTVAIPARNETADLEACLLSLVSSDYPKLEILVLDDCSQNKQTPDVIRGFAHAGVRFLAGQTPPGHWLAKNYAYAQLTDEANGDLLLFCGVDVRFESSSLRSLVEILLQKKKSMISVLPLNQLPPGRRISRLFVQPNRYAWEFALPRRLIGRPPVLSTCWLIRRQALKRAGSFAAASRKILPESYLARQTAAVDDGYSFLRSNTEMGISSLKSFDEQQATAIRTRYPQLHRRPEMVALVGLAEFSALLWPLIILTVALISKAWLLAAISGLAYLLAAITYGTIVNLTYRQTRLRGLWLLPLAVIYDISLLNYSMWQYEFSEVIWKGRNICLPVMRAAPGAEKSR